MTHRRGYRVDLPGPLALHAFVSTLRRDAGRVFVRLYGRILADEVASFLDGHRSGLRPGGEGSPLRDATASVRAAYAGAAPDGPLGRLDLRLGIAPLARGLIVRFDRGHRDYEAMLASIEGVAEAHVGGPSAAPDEAERQAAWDEAMSGAPMGRWLSFVLVEDGLPALRQDRLRRLYPSHEARCLRTARLVVAARGERGEVAVEREARRLARLLPREIGPDDVAAYAPSSPPAALPAPRARGPSAPASFVSVIDHADVVEAADGRVFVAVPEAGLDPRERVHLAVQERYITFVQGATHFGAVPNAPHAAIEILRRTREVQLVEIAPGPGGRPQVRTRHVALVRDDTLPDFYNVAMGGLRSLAMRGRRRPDVQWMEG